MRSIVPIAGHEKLDPMLLEHLLFHIERMGHEPLCLNEINTLEILKANPVKFRVPLFIGVRNGTENKIITDLAQLIQDQFATAKIIYDVPRTLPYQLLQCYKTHALCSPMTTPDCVSSALKFIYSKLDDEKLTVTEVIHRAYSNKVKLERLFHKYFNEGIWQHIITMRIDEAKRLLLETDEPICQIAMSVGILDSSSFSRSFKKKTLVTPSQYRRKSQIN